MSVIFPWLVVVSVLFCLALLSVYSVQKVTPPCFLDEDNVMRCNQCKKMTYSFKGLTASEGEICWPWALYMHACIEIETSLDSRPRRERRPGIPCMRMRVHYPKKGVIRVFVDTVSKINRILFVFWSYSPLHRSIVQRWLSSYALYCISSQVST